jgi:hypothetical protein
MTVIMATSLYVVFRHAERFAPRAVKAVEDRLPVGFRFFPVRNEM